MLHFSTLGLLVPLVLWFTATSKVCLALPTDQRGREKDFVARDAVDDICKLDILETRTCESQDSRLYARIRLEGPNQILFHETPPIQGKPGLSINENKPLELKEWMMDYILRVTGRHREDDVQFEFGPLRWSTETKKGAAKCRLVSDGDWDKPGEGCQVDSRRFECNFPCGTQ